MATYPSPAYDINGNLVTVNLEGGDYANLPQGFFVSPGQAAAARGQTYNPQQASTGAPVAAGTQAGFTPTPNPPAPTPAQMIAQQYQQNGYETPTGDVLDQIVNSGLVPPVTNQLPPPPPTVQTASATPPQVSAPPAPAPSLGSALAGTTTPSGFVGPTVPGAPAANLPVVPPLPVSSITTPTATTPPAVTPTATAPTATTPAPTTTPTATTPSATTGQGPGMTYDQALQLYLQTHPGANVNDAAGQQAFNQWSSQTFGPGGFENAPAGGTTAAGGTTNTPTTLGGGLDSIVNSALTAGANKAAGSGGNLAQVQSGAQTGQYTTGTTGFNNQQTAQNTATTGQQNTSNQFANQGQTTSSGTQQGQTSTSGTTTGTNTQATTGQQQGLIQTTALDQFGLGGLAHQLGQSAGAATSAQQGFLTNALQQGNPQLQSQVDQAVRQSLTGPQMTGAGDSTRARAAGYAAADVARNSFGQQLQAASALGGPTAAGTAIQQASPFIGQQQATSGTSAQNTSGTTAQQTLGQTLSNLTNSGVQSSNQTGTSSGATSSAGSTAMSGAQTGQTGQTTGGTATGSNTSIGVGQVPQQSAGGGSGCYVCTAFVDRGWIRPSTVRRAVLSKLRFLPTYELPLHGYMLYGPVLAWLVLRSRCFARLFLPIARAVLLAELRLGKSTPASAKFWHAAFTVGSFPFGCIAKIAKVPRSPRAMAWLLNKHNLNFKEQV